MKSINENDLKGFVLEGSVVVSWKFNKVNKREFVGLHFAGFDETISEIIQENEIPENLIKHNILVPKFQLDNLNEIEKKILIEKALNNNIWNWDKSYDFTSLISEHLI